MYETGPKMALSGSRGLAAFEYCFVFNQYVEDY